MNKELFEKFVALAKEKGFAPNLDEVNYETANQLTELKEKLNLDELPEFLIDEIITGSFEYSHKKQIARAAKIRSNGFQQVIKNRNQNK